MAKLLIGKTVYLIDVANGYGISGCVYLGETIGQYGGTSHSVQKIECQTVIGGLTPYEVISNFTEAEIRVGAYKHQKSYELTSEIDKLQTELNKLK